ncbi:hypothetical protein SHIRM173S_05926 [Streptomyces hirsutus]
MTSRMSWLPTISFMSGLLVPSPYRSGRRGAGDAVGTPGPAACGSRGADAWGVGSGAGMGGSCSVRVVRVLLEVVRVPVARLPWVALGAGAAQDGGDLGRVGVEALRSAARQTREAGQQVAEGVDLADREPAPPCGRSRSTPTHRVRGKQAAARSHTARTSDHRPPPACTASRTASRSPRLPPRWRLVSGEVLVRTTAWVARPSTTTIRRSAARPPSEALGSQRSRCRPSGASVSTIAAMSRSRS